MWEAVTDRAGKLNSHRVFERERSKRLGAMFPAEARGIIRLASVASAFENPLPRLRPAVLGAKLQLKPTRFPERSQLLSVFQNLCYSAYSQYPRSAHVRRGAPKKPIHDRRVPVLPRLHPPAPRGDDSTKGDDSPIAEAALNAPQAVDS